MKFKSRTLSLAVLFTTTLAACQDVLAPPRSVALSPAAPAFGKAATAGTVPVSCIVTIFTPSGPTASRSHRINFKLPKRVQAADGERVVFQARVHGGGKKLERLATCTIPQTAEAIRMVSRRFHIPGSTVVPKPISEPEGEMTTMDCYRQPDGSYLCDGIEGGGGGNQSYCQENPTDPACTGGYGGEDPWTEPCNGDMQACGGPGLPTDPGYTPPPPTGLPGDLDGDGDAFDDGPGAFATCVGAMLVLSVSTASQKLYFDDLYEAARDLSAAERELQMVKANNPSLEMLIIYQDKREKAQKEYEAAKKALSVVAGATAVTIGAAVVACSPTLLLPTP